MNKKSIIIAVVIVVLLIFISGAVETNKPESSGEYFTFTDSEGEIVELSHKPQKTAVLFSSLAECWIEAGGEVYVTVGESVERGFVKEETELVDKGAGKTVDTEKLISLEPDFVICSADIASHRDVASALKKAKIPVAMLRMDTFEDYLTILRTLTKITGKTENYEQFGENAKSEIEQIISGGKRENNPKILFVRSGSSYSSAKRQMITLRQKFSRISDVSILPTRLKLFLITLVPRLYSKKIHSIFLCLLWVIMIIARHTCRSFSLRKSMLLLML